MKKLSARSVILFLLIAASLCSYIYLNTVQQDVTAPLTTNEQNELSELEEAESVILPDVSLMKRAFELGKRFVQNY